MTDDIADWSRSVEDPRLARPLRRRKPQKPRTKPNLKEETLLQKRVFTMLQRVLDPEWAMAFAIPNGSLRDIVTAIELKAMGATAGVFDLVILSKSPTQYDKTDWIELKIWPKDLSGSQPKFAAFVDKIGQRRATCWTECDVLLTILSWRIPHDTDLWEKWWKHYLPAHELVSAAKSKVR